MNTFETLNKIYEDIAQLKKLKDTTFYGHDGNLLYNTDSNKCYVDANKIEAMDDLIDSLNKGLIEMSKPEPD